MDDAKDYFAQELYYDYGFEEKQYNGNLAGVQWKNADGSQQAYGYLYDEVNRITGADYRSRQGSSWAEQAGSHSLDGVSYDKNGNIETLKRYGKVNGLTYILDELSYGYQGNRLASVADDGEQSVGFVDGETQSSREYGYDASGNMTSDSNKGISSTSYDPVLNLPLEVVTKTGTIQYAYNAAGGEA